MRKTIGTRQRSRTKCRVSQEIKPQADGTMLLQLGFSTDSDQPRPRWWNRLPEILRRIGFELESDLDGSMEIFTPTSFFSGSVLVSATKAYFGKTTFTHDIEDDISRVFTSLVSEQRPWPALPRSSSPRRMSA